MAIVTLTNSTSPNTVERATDDQDPYERETQLDSLAHNFDDHDHTAGKNLGVGRVQTSSAPAAAGGVRVNGDTWQWWGATAGAVRTAVDLEGAQTVAGQKTFSDELLAASGDATTPGYSFSGDTNTGIFRGGADILALATGGTARLTVAANGDVYPTTVITTAATGGFLGVGGAAGAPTGVPTNHGGIVQVYYDTTNDRLYFYNHAAGAWRWRSINNT